MSVDWLQEFLAVIKLDDVALAGIVTLALVWVLSGRLIPRATHQETVADRDAWRAAYLESERARGILVSQNGELLEVAKTANQILRSLPGGESHVGEATQSPAPTRP